MTVPGCTLDTVSTTCGSGWVRSLYACIEEVSRRPKLRTHPLPQVVLTVSNVQPYGKSGPLQALSSSRFS